MQNYNYNNQSYQNMNYGRQPRNDINQYVFVNGIEGAKAFQMMPNTSIMLMDSDSSTIFMKTSDIQGKCTLRYFKMVEVNEEDLKQPKVEPNYATREELDSLSKKLEILSSKLDKLNKKGE